MAQERRFRPAGRVSRSGPVPEEQVALDRAGIDVLLPEHEGLARAAVQGVERKIAAAHHVGREFRDPPRNKAADLGLR